MKTVLLANQKGGVGKSAVATLLAQYCARQRCRTLAIDLDHQGNFTAAVMRSHRATLAPVTADQLMTTERTTVPADPFVLVPASDALMLLERQPAMHTPFARTLSAFLRSVDRQFDICVVDTNPNPDIRVIAAMATADFLLSPIQLNQEAIDGVRALLHHRRVGFHKIKALLNPRLELIGLLPTLVEATPYQRANFVAIISNHLDLLIKLSERPGDLASIPKRSAIPESQASGTPLWDIKKTAARDAWTEIEPSLRHIVGRILLESKPPEVAPADPQHAVA